MEVGTAIIQHSATSSSCKKSCERIGEYIGSKTTLAEILEEINRINIAHEQLPHSSCWQWCALVNACCVGNASLVKELFNLEEAKPYFSKGDGVLTPLVCAVECGDRSLRLQTVKALLDLGADLNIPANGFYHGSLWVVAAKINDFSHIHLVSQCWEVSQSWRCRKTPVPCRPLAVVALTTEDFALACLLILRGANREHRLHRKGHAMLHHAHNYVSKMVLIFLGYRDSESLWGKLPCELVSEISAIGLELDFYSHP